MPAFNRCLQQTILVAGPLAILCIFGPINLYCLRKYRRKEQSTPFNLYNVSRLLAVVLIILVNFTQFFYDFWFGSFHYQIAWMDLASFSLNGLIYVSKIKF